MARGRSADEWAGYEREWRDSVAAGGTVRRDRALKSGARRHVVRVGNSRDFSTVEVEVRDPVPACGQRGAGYRTGNRVHYTTNDGEHRITEVAGPARSVPGWVYAVWGVCVPPLNLPFLIVLMLLLDACGVV